MGRDTSSNRGVGLLYLAGAVDAAGDDSRSWRDDVSELLVNMGFSTFSPPHAFQIGKLTPEVAGAVQVVNTMALRSSIAVVANAKGQSWGTPLECEEAIKMRNPIPVFVFGGSMRSVYQWRYNCWVAMFESILPFMDEWLTTLD